MKKQLNLTFIGTGYVGLVSGTCIADLGHNVTCMDIDARKIEMLNNGDIPIYEPGLKELVAKNVAEGRLKFTTDLGTCVAESDAVFICVGTPQTADGSAKLDYVYQAAEDVAKQLNGFTVVVTKSTVPTGTNRKVASIVASTNADADFAVASNPEFLREGKAIEDFAEPDRVVVGVENDRAAEIMQAIYQPQIDAGFTYQAFDKFETAEIIKYAANAFLAMKISFINEIATLCEKTGANVDDIATGIGVDHRIGSAFLKTGPGYGGSCFPKDTNALAFIGQQHGAPQSLVARTIEVNEQVKQRMISKVIEACGGSVAGKTIAVWGLAFKPGTDDMRDAASLTILPELARQGAILQAHDPAAMENAKAILEDKVAYCTSEGEALNNTDALLILTEWDIYQKAPTVKDRLNQPLMIDLRNMFTPEEMTEQGWTYHCIGKASSADLKAEAAA